jgi:hypothetical protein
VSAPEIEISVTASGQVFLDGREVSLSELEEALPAAKLDGTTVRYTRENPESDAPEVAEQVMKLIAANRLRIAFSPSPDIPVEKTAKVLEFPGIETIFAKVRRQAAKHRGIVLVRPDNILYQLAAPPEGSISEPMIAGVKAMISSEQPRNIAAIAAVGALAAEPGKAPALRVVGRKVPFFGLLIGLAYAGNAVWIFEGVESMVPAGCEDADVLIIDSDAVATLPRDWATDAGRIMRNSNILVYDRTREKMGALQTAGVVPGRIEFPN